MLNLITRGRGGLETDKNYYIICERSHITYEQKSYVTYEMIMTSLVSLEALVSLVKPVTVSVGFATLKPLTSLDEITQLRLYGRHTRILAHNLAKYQYFWTGPSLFDTYSVLLLSSTFSPMVTD